ncbi:MAG TPA: hypothetical protein VIV40_19875 [Kofleriaceae bacterium]
MKRWPEIRAGLILLVICFGLIDGCPLPPRDDTPAWEKGFVEPIREVQHVALTPVEWIRTKLRVGQRWALYQRPTTERYRMWIEAQDRRGHWHLLFRAGDSAHQEDAELIDYSRPRGAWDPTDKPPYQYPLFADWISARVLANHRDYVIVRVRLEKVHITEDDVVPTGQFVFPHMFLRSGS